MKARQFLVSLTCATIVAVSLSVQGFAGSLTLHPAGFGPFSYAAWKAQQGLPDDTGNANQALYFQKMTTTGTYAAGVAVINGVQGMPASALTGLSWEHREDG